MWKQHELATGHHWNSKHPTEALCLGFVNLPAINIVHSILLYIRCYFCGVFLIRLALLWWQQNPWTVSWRILELLGVIIGTHLLITKINGMHAYFPAISLHLINKWVKKVIVASFLGIFFRLLQRSPNMFSVGTS